MDQLIYESSLDFTGVLNFLRPRAINGVEVVLEEEYSRTYRMNDSQGWFKISKGDSCLQVELVGALKKDKELILNQVRRMFDLNTNFERLNRQFGKDPILSQGMRNGMVPRLPQGWNPYEFTLRAILGQQITVKAATTLAGRIAARADKKPPKDFPRGLTFYFPSPAEVIKMDLSQIGLTKTREATVLNTTEALLEGKFKLDMVQDFEIFFNDFTALKGIGPWTAQYVGMRGLGFPDCFPVADLGIIKALSPEGRRLSIKEIEKIAEKWRPYRAYAALCLWQTLK